MKKSLSFLILVIAALLSLAYEAKLPSAREVPVPSLAPQAAATLKAPGKPRLPASQAQPLEIEEVDAQN